MTSVPVSLQGNFSYSSTEVGPVKGPKKQGFRCSLTRGRDQAKHLRVMDVTWKSRAVLKLRQLNSSGSPSPPSPPSARREGPQPLGLR